MHYAIKSEGEISRLLDEIRNRFKRAKQEEKDERFKAYFIDPATAGSTKSFGEFVNEMALEGKEVGLQLIRHEKLDEQVWVMDIN